MPRYLSSRDGEFQRYKRRSFATPDHLIHFLSSTTDDSWAPFKKIATEYATNKRTPPRRLKLSHVRQVATSHPRDLVSHVVEEFNSHIDPERESLLGGGISDTLHTIGHEVGHLFGLDKLSDLIFGGPDVKERSRESEVAAYLVKQTYQPVNKRPLVGVDGWKRLSTYDTDFYSVWEKPDGELLVTIRGTKLNNEDIKADLKLMVGADGGKLDSLDPLFDKLEKDFPGVKYDVAAHSLGTHYLIQEFAEHRDNMDDVFLFNIASSPMQDKATLQAIANLDANYYINSGDLVSSGAYQNMNRETLDNNLYLGDYAWSPLAAHSLTQWYNQDDMDKERKRLALAESQKKIEPEGPKGETAEMSLDTKETREAGLS